MLAPINSRAPRAPQDRGARTGPSLTEGRAVCILEVLPDEPSSYLLATPLREDEKCESRPAAKPSPTSWAAHGAQRQARAVSRVLTCDGCGDRILPDDPPPLTMRGHLGALDFHSRECVLTWAEEDWEEDDPPGRR